MKLKRVLDHAAVFNFWKPTQLGEKIYGKLVEIPMNQNGRILQIETAEEIKHVAVSTVLEHLDWESYIGKTVQLTFTGNVLSKAFRNYMTFDVDVEI